MTKIIIPPDLFASRRRSFEQLEPLSARLVQARDGRVLVQVCSTQYLGLPWIESVMATIAQVVGNAPSNLWGSLGSNYLGGTHPERVQFEKRVASMCRREGALAFVSGWAANYAVGEAIGKLFGLVVSDRRCHNSIIHGLRAGKARVVVLDLAGDELLTTIDRYRNTRIAVIAPTLEGITGEAVLPHLAPFREDVFLIRDECHSFGAVGETGFEEFDNLRPEVRIVGFSKACGTIGAAVCGDHDFLDVLSQLASPWIFSTAVPPIVWRVNGALIDLIGSLTAERQRIHRLATLFRERATAAMLTHRGEFHITGLNIPPTLDPGRLEAEFSNAGFWIKISQYPSRPKDSPCARVVFSPVHEEQDGERLALVASDLLLEN